MATDEDHPVTNDSDQHPGHYRHDNRDKQDPGCHENDSSICKNDNTYHVNNRETNEKATIDEEEDNTDEEKGNALDKICPQIDQRVLVPKAFYTFFYTAIGALFPYLPVYFKQLHLTPHQTGVLIGVRPLIQFLATPIWGAVADRFCKGKAILLMSVIGWLVSNVLLAMVPESRHTRLCDKSMDYDPKLKELSDSVMLMRRSMFNFNASKFQLSNPRMNNNNNNNNNNNKVNIYMLNAYNTKNKSESLFRDDLTDTTFDISKSRHQKEFKKENSSSQSRTTSLVSPARHPWALSLMEDEESLTHVLHDNITSEPKVFRFLLAVTVIGTLVSAPTHVMADTATLTSLDGALHKYGKVRLWGSLGWGVGGFSVGAAVSTSYSTRCNGEVIINYFPCFYVYAVSMGIAFMCATQFRYNRADADKLMEKSDSSGLRNALKVLRNPQYCFILVIAFYCGSATGFIETFLFWYLHELGGEQFLFSVVNGMNCAAEVCVFLVSDRLISCFGHVNIIYLALVCYSLRFLYFYFLVSPWWVLPAELLQGVTTAALWASCVSYVGLHPGASHTLQGILNGVYMGLGFAAGGFVGGGVVHLVGMPNAFLIYAVVSIVLCLVFVALNKYHGN